MSNSYADELVKQSVKNIENNKMETAHHPILHIKKPIYLIRPRYPIETHPAIQRNLCAERKPRRPLSLSLTRSPRKFLNTSAPEPSIAVSLPKHGFAATAPVSPRNQGFSPSQTI